MLPFLQKKRETGVFVQERAPDEKEPFSESDNENESLEACMDDLISALNTGSSKKAAEAFKAAFQVCESYPHEENEERPEPHSYDASKEQS